MDYGYISKYLEIDLNTQCIKEFDFETSIKRHFIGGYGIGCKYIYENCKAKIDPLGEENILAFLTGPLNGFKIPGTARYAVCGKSPLTGTWGDSNCGGSFGPIMKKAGFDGIFFKGISENPCYLLLNDGEARLIDAADIWGMDTYAVDDYMKERFGIKAETACIGQAGEKKSLISAIITNKGRAAARSGLAAVMGSKKIKAIVAKGDKEIPIANQNLLEESRRKYLKDISNNYGDAAWLRAGGTPSLIYDGIKGQDSPIKNWSGTVRDMPDYKEYNYENVKKYIIKREGCYSCPLRCWSMSNISNSLYFLDKPVHTPEYETSAMFGPLCLNSNYESIIKCNDLCNRYGIDTISTGSTVAFAIECFENDILSIKDTDGLKLNWGNHEAIVQLVEKIGERNGIGEILADGSKAASKKIGKKSEKYAIQIGGQELPAHDTRWDPGLAIIYSIDPTPARHMQANQNLGHKDIENIFPDVDFSMCAGNKRELSIGRGRSLKYLSSIVHTVNASGGCLFSWGCTDLTTHLNIFRAITGWDMTYEELITTGERIMNLRQSFNLREGINQINYVIPKRILGKPPLDYGGTKGITLDLELMRKEFYNEMEWDFLTSRPGKDKLKELGLSTLINDLYKI